MNKFYYAILSKSLPSKLDAMVFEIQSIMNGIPKENLKRLKVDGRYRIIRKISYQEIAATKYYHKDHWIKRLKKDTEKVREWRKSKARRKK